MGTPSAEKWFDRVTADEDETVVSSRILRTELTRVLRREDRPVVERDAILDYLGVVRLTEGILTSAEAVSDHIKTLDSIHLASAIAMGSETVVVTHDANLTKTAESLGFTTFDPLRSVD